MLTDFDDKIFLNFSLSNGNPQMTFTYGEASPILFVKYEKAKFSNKELQDTYAGTYFCKALNTRFNMQAENGKLIASNEASRITFTAITDQLFSGDQWYMGSIEFQSDEDGRTKGLFLRNDAIRNLWFEKMN